MKIIDCDDEIIKECSSLMNLFYRLFGEKDVNVYAVLEDDKKLGFIARCEQTCAFIDSSGNYTLFVLDELDNLYAVGIDGYTVIKGDKLYLANEEKEYSLELVKLDEPDEQGYDGCISFLQYDKKRDIMCEITYQQNYCEYKGKTPIYGYHAKRIDRLFIDENYSEKDYHCGILPKSSKYFIKSEFAAGTIGYDIAAIKDYGLGAFLSTGSYNLLRENNAVRYSKIFAIDRDGNFRDLWPLGKTLTEEEVKAIVEQYGLMAEVPEEFISIYNGYNRSVNKMKEAAALLQEIQKTIKDPGDSRRMLILTVKKDKIEG